jgi:hypothetical protein
MEGLADDREVSNSTQRHTRVGGPIRKTFALAPPEGLLQIAPQDPLVANHVRLLGQAEPAAVRIVVEPQVQDRRVCVGLQYASGLVRGAGTGISGRTLKCQRRVTEKGDFSDSSAAFMTSFDPTDYKNTWCLHHDHGLHARGFFPIKRGSTRLVDS